MTILALEAEGSPRIECIDTPCCNACVECMIIMWEDPFKAFNEKETLIFKKKSTEPPLDALSAVDSVKQFLVR